MIEKVVRNFRRNLASASSSQARFSLRLRANSSRMKGETMASYFPSRANSSVWEGGLSLENPMAEKRTLVSRTTRMGLAAGFIDQTLHRFIGLKTGFFRFEPP